MSLITTNSIALNGVPFSLTRHLRDNAHNPDAVTDWQGEVILSWHGLLGNETFATLTITVSTGVVLIVRDAKGNRRPDNVKRLSG